MRSNKVRDAQNQSNLNKQDSDKAKPTAQFSDNREESVVQQKVQEMANTYSTANPIQRTELDPVAGNFVKHSKRDKVYKVEKVENDVMELLPISGMKFPLKVPKDQWENWEITTGEEKEKVLSQDEIDRKVIQQFVAQANFTTSPHIFKSATGLIRAFLSCDLGHQKVWVIGDVHPDGTAGSIWVLGEDKFFGLGNLDGTQAAVLLANAPAAVSDYNVMRDIEP